MNGSVLAQRAVRPDPLVFTLGDKSNLKARRKILRLRSVATRISTPAPIKGASRISARRYCADSRDLDEYLGSAVRMDYNDNTVAIVLNPDKRVVGIGLILFALSGRIFKEGFKTGHRNLSRSASTDHSLDWAHSRPIAFW